jgi:hypothetical protein
MEKCGLREYRRCTRFCEIPKFPFAIPAPSGIGNHVKIPDSKIRITFPDRVYGEDSIG